MANEWILDVLTDLSTFAEANDLPKLERQLRFAMDAALQDLASGQGMTPDVAQRGIDVGSLHRSFTEGPNT